MVMGISPPEAISEAIRIGRKNAGMSQSALAKASGMSQSTIARIENDIENLNPSYRTIFRVAGALSSTRNFAEGRVVQIRARQIMHKAIIFSRPGDLISDAIKMFKNYDFPQLPVLDGSRHVVGTLYQKDLLSIAVQNPEMAKSRTVTAIMRGPLPQMGRDTDIAALKPILEASGAVIVVDRGRAVGIITVYDILNTV